MARETDLIDSAVDVAEVIHEYARRKGWDREKYNVQMIINSNFYILYIYLFMEVSVIEDEKQKIYDDLFDAIHKKYKKNRGLPFGFNSYGINIEGKGDIMEGKMPYYEDAIYVDSALLNPPPVGAAR